MPHRIPIRLPAAFVAEDDRSLLERFAAGHDENAFAVIVGRYSRMVYGVCKRAMRDEHLAEDAFQAVFLVLARNPDRASSASSVAGWLFGIARRVGLAARRRESRRRTHEAKTAEKPAAGHPSDFDDLLRSLDEELAALPERFRAPLIACFLEEQTQDEAARQLGWSLSTLRRRLERGKELLRARLLRRGATLAATLFAATVAPSAHASVPVRLVAMAMHPSPRAQLLAAELARGAVAARWGIATLALVLMTGLAAAFTRIPDATRPSAAAAATASTVEATPVPRQAQPSPVSLSGQVVF
ncbi:MAG TPA: sigma-70 family RNA polymerase sigma factor, partial [Gemmata sp.]|nr:sigma-70 family RNA polymerase sigma factor [Gemmata sp.]